MLPKIGKEITKQWKTPVSSLRGTKGLGKASVNPLARAGNELRGRATSARSNASKK